MKLTIAEVVNKPFLIEINGTEYKVRYTALETARAEAVVGRPLKWLGAWLTLKWEDIPKVLVEGLVDLKTEDRPALLAILDEQLTPEQLAEIHESLCWTAWPRGMEEMRKRAEGKAAGKPSPNAPSGDAH